MTVGELIERLEQEDEGAEIRLAHQPSYPLQSTLRGVVSAAEVADPDEVDVDTVPDFVYLVEGSQDRDQPYAPRDVFEGAY